MTYEEFLEEIEKRDKRLAEWLEQFAVSVHRDIKRVEDRVNANFDLLAGEVRSQRSRIAELEEQHDTWPAPPCADAE